MIRMELGGNSYDIVIERGALGRAGELFDLDRKVMIVTDEAVPAGYADTVASQCGNARVMAVAQGEKSKSLRTAEEILREMLRLNFDRGDCVAAVGGGVTGDLAGFVASVYMRGVDFYNIPTTVLSQVDSSIGGKTAVNLDGFKNMVGSFYQPGGVLIDPETLRSLPKRQAVNGFMEAIKTGAVLDAGLFDLFLDDGWEGDTDEIIGRSLLAKKYVVERDEKEKHLRKILNFGHTLGHAFERAAKGRYLHGECVALGMLFMCSDEVADRLLDVYGRMGFRVPLLSEFDMDEVKEAIVHDKKAAGDICSVVFVRKIGEGEIEEWPTDRVIGRLESVDLEKRIR